MTKTIEIIYLLNTGVSFLSIWCKRTMSFEYLMYSVQLWKKETKRGS